MNPTFDQDEIPLDDPVELRAHSPRLRVVPLRGRTVGGNGAGVLVPQAACEWAQRPGCSFPNRWLVRRQMGVDRETHPAQASTPYPGRMSDPTLIDAVEGLVRVYEQEGRTDDCVRLTTAQARQLVQAARRGLRA